MFTNDGPPNNSNEDHAPVKKEKKKKEKISSSNDGGGSTSLSNAIPVRHKKEPGQSVTIAPISGSQLVSPNVFTTGQDLKPAEGQKKKRRGLKNK